MAHRRLVLRERITAIVGSSILLVLIGMSYYYSIQSGLSGLRYSPISMKRASQRNDLSLRAWSTFPMSACERWTQDS